MWIRLKLNESPAYERMKAEAGDQRAPFRESFLRKNLRFVLIALFGVMIAQGAVSYWWIFLHPLLHGAGLKVDVNTVDQLMLAVTAVSAFCTSSSLGCRTGSAASPSCCSA